MTFIQTNIYKTIIVAIGLCFLAIGFSADAQVRTNLPIFELTGEKKTIGDIKPSFIVFEDKDLPDVSIEYVVQRYITLFETAQAPDVKVDVLNRINNLQAKYGIDSKKLSIDTVRQSKAVLESYNAIVDTGIYYDRMDELLYQTAKASSFIGKTEDAIKRLKLLVGLHPRSALADEAKFRLAEAYFDIGEYQKAELEYKRLLAHSKSEKFKTKARFMLAWSVFRQERYADTEKNSLLILDQFPSLAGQDNFESVPSEDQDVVADILRLLAISFSKQEGAESLEDSQAREKNSKYAYLLYDSLFRHYLAQERYQESAQVASRYASSYLDRDNAYLMGLNAIKSYQAGDLDILTWSSKEEFAENFGVNSYVWEQATASLQADLSPHLILYTDELAHLYYTRMQRAKKKNKDDHTEFGARAADYYQQLASLQKSSSLIEQQQKQGEALFLSAEALRDTGKYADSIQAYEQSGFVAPSHQFSEQAAYASILTFDQLELQTSELTGDQTKRKRKNILAYTANFRENERTPVLLNFLANSDFDSNQFESAVSLSEQVLALNNASPEVRYSSQLISAHGYYELGRFNEAQTFYQQVLGNPRSKSKQKDLKERLAASIYNQASAEQDALLSAELYLSLVDAVPDSSAVPNALYDAGAQFLSASAWSQAVASLTHFQERFPKHELYRDTNDKLIFAYTQSGDFVSAADKLIERSEYEQDRDKSALGLFQAAQFYTQSSLLNEAAELYNRFIGKFPEKFDLNVEAFQKVIDIEARFNASRAKALKQKFVAYEQEQSDQRTEESATLAAGFVFEDAQEKITAFNRSKLSLPLKKSLKIKKAKLQNAVDALESVAEYGIPKYQSGSTHAIAQLYKTLAQDLLDSERPTTLNELQLEQYDILLEEQAFPFEEQAIGLFELNTSRVLDGQYDDWVKQSFEVLAEINPIKYLRQPKDSGYAESMY